jgi:hypothetical protein
MTERRPEDEPLDLAAVARLNTQHDAIAERAKQAEVTRIEIEEARARAEKTIRSGGGSKRPWWKFWGK